MLAQESTEGPSYESRSTGQDNVHRRSLTLLRSTFAAMIRLARGFFSVHLLTVLPLFGPVFEIGFLADSVLKDDRVNDLAATGTT
jgi:hypothetical protein